MPCVNCKHEAPAWKWLPIPSADAKKVDAAISRWVGTPFAKGNRVAQMGADCVNLGIGVLDDLYGFEDPTRIPRLSPDAGVHNDQAAMEIARLMRRRYDSFVVRDFTLSPGDAIVTTSTPRSSSPRSHQGHLMIQSSRPFLALDISRARPASISSVLSSFGQIVRVYRAKDRSQWQPPQHSPS